MVANLDDHNLTVRATVRTATLTGEPPCCRAFPIRSARITSSRRGCSLAISHARSCRLPPPFVVLDPPLAGLAGPPVATASPLNIPKRQEGEPRRLRRRTQEVQGLPTLPQTAVREGSGSNRISGRRTE
jgi:hypothetical protein